jgi:hypothetical protein
LDNLTSIGGFLGVYNLGLTSFIGLNNLISIGGDLRIGPGNALTNFAGLNNLISIGGALYIGYNDSLTNLTGLESVTSIGGDLEIYNNYFITSLMALEGVTSIGRNLEIFNNDALHSLSGLDNINAGSIANLSIYNNSSLSTCEVQSICEYLANPNGTIEIYNNAPGCNSQVELEEACGVSVDNMIVDNPFSMYPNPTSTQITVEIPEISNQSILTIMNINGQELIKCQITELKTVIDITNLPKGIYFVRLTGERTVGVEKIIKE